MDQIKGLTEPEKTVWHAMESINHAWVNEDINMMIPLLHPDICMVMPDQSELAKGRDILIESFRQFVDSVEIHQFVVEEKSVQIIGNTAVVRYRYSLTYTMEEHRITDKGWDMFIFEKIEDTWIAVWRTMWE
ncbi:nuclear transport factor 2 family protein [bacterium]|nr:nuclear transport factor 2 family protein [bacterium]